MALDLKNTVCDPPKFPPIEIILTSLTFLLLFVLVEILVDRIFFKSSIILLIVVKHILNAIFRSFIFLVAVFLNTSYNFDVLLNFRDNFINTHTNMKFASLFAVLLLLFAQAADAITFNDFSSFNNGEDFIREVDDLPDVIDHFADEKSDDVESSDNIEIPTCKQITADIVEGKLFVEVGILTRKTKRCLRSVLGRKKYSRFLRRYRKTINNKIGRHPFLSNGIRYIPDDGQQYAFRVGGSCSYGYWPIGIQLCTRDVIQQCSYINTYVLGWYCKN